MAELRKVQLKISQFYPKQSVFNYINHNFFSEENNDVILAERFTKAIGYYPNVQEPKTLNEKILWLSQNYHNQLATLCVDRYLVKQYIKEQLGEDLCFSTIRKYDSIYDVDLNEYPGKFVIKVNWNLGKNQTINVINKDKSSLDLIRAKLDNWTQPWNNLYYTDYNWPYKDVKPIMFAEEYVDKKACNKYKVYCFNGKADFALLDMNCYSLKYKRSIYDRNFKETDFTIGKTSKVQLKTKPQNFDRVIELADKLSKPFPFVRVDFYEIGGKIYFEQFLFGLSSSFSKIKPLEWDYKLGEKLNLPEKS